ncbi:MAG: CapA family protein [Mediterranea sp.]|jgi:poly-gamma-glutamate synthesis protein (capsule biosynthesis protein)|nr:CapA family protein [Mediterranea sp.]
MRQLLLLLITILPLACAAQPQAKGDSVSTPPTTRADTLSLLFVGDLMQHQAQIDAARTPSGGYDYSPCFALVEDDVRRADWAVANLEVTLAGKPYKGYPAFSAPDEFLAAIHEAGFDVLVTANNHSLDRGRKGLERTIQLLDSLRMPHAGTYASATSRAARYPLLLEKKGIRVGLLNYTYGTNGLAVSPPNVVNYIDTALIARDIAACQAMRPDVIIACMHWGVEYQSNPSREQKRLADWLLEKGVDHIIGSHPHVAQPIEVRTDSLTRKKHLVVYSLGNYISNMSARNTDGGLTVRMYLVKDSVSTRLVASDYSLVWTARPAQTGEKNYQLIPIDAPLDSIRSAPIDSLPQAARDSLKLFAKTTRALLEKYNQGIRERLPQQ